MRLIIHAGTAKTGTTSLQDNLARHSGLLQEHGILYPVVAGGRKDHNLLTTMLVPRSNWVRGFRAEPDSISNAALDLWQYIVSMAKRWRPTVTILSGEFFFAMPPSGWHRLRELADQTFATTEVVVYVREPAGYYLSRMQQTVKGSGTIAPPCKDRFDVRSGIEAIAGAYGRNVEVRAFDTSLLTGGCIVRDFLSKLPNVAPPEMAVQRFNEGMSAEAICILQRAHQLALPPVGRITPTSTRIARALGLLQRGTKARLRPGIAALLRAAAAEELVWLERNHGIRFPLADEPVPSSTPPGWQATEASDILDVTPEAVEAALYDLLVTLAKPRAVPLTRRGGPD